MNVSNSLTSNDGYTITSAKVGLARTLSSFMAMHLSPLCFQVFHASECRMACEDVFHPRTAPLRDSRL